MTSSPSHARLSQALDGADTGSRWPRSVVHFNRRPFWKRSFWDPDDTILYDEAGNGVAVARDQRDGVKPESPSRSR